MPDPSWREPLRARLASLSLSPSREAEIDGVIAYAVRGDGARSASGWRLARSRATSAGSFCAEV